MTFALDCPGLTNLATNAGHYASMTGTLAGFAFTAIVLLVTPTQIDERESTGRTALKDEILPILMAAFMVLIITTLIYSTLSGEDVKEARGRAATELLMDGITFGLAVIMLFNGITLLLLAGSIDRIAVWTARVMTVVTAPTLTLFYLTNGAAETERARSASIDNTCISTPGPTLGLVLSGILAATLTLSLIPRLQAPMVRSLARKLQRRVPIAVLAISISDAFVSDILWTKPPNFLLSPRVLTLYFVVMFTLLLVLGLVISLSHPDDMWLRKPSLPVGIDTVHTFNPFAAKPEDVRRDGPIDTWAT
jgi:hypothetical protein